MDIGIHMLKGSLYQAEMIDTLRRALGRWAVAGRGFDGCKQFVKCPQPGVVAERKE